MHLTTILCLYISQISAIVHPWIAEPNTLPLFPDQPNWWMLQHVSLLTQNLQNGSDTQIVFIGDSITAFWLTDLGIDTWNQFYASRGAYNYGVAGDQTQNVIWRIEHMELDCLNAKVVVLMIGNIF